MPTELHHFTWCLNGPLAFLPLHAAGDYSAQAEVGSKLSDYAVSSYIPSLTALSNAQQPRELTNSTVLTVNLPVEGELPYSSKEIAAINHVLGSSKPVELSEENASAENVKKGMEKYSFIHFACHGQQDLTDPTQSALLLANKGRLTLEDIIDLKLPHAQLAFLSACETAAGDIKIQEEAFHLAGGLLIAGYRGVVGTLWAIQDSDGPLVAQEFYKQLSKDGTLDVKQAAYALHHAVQKLRIQSNSFLQWVPFIHLGI